MQKLHLVGFTPDHDGLILSTRKGAKSGGFVVPVDTATLERLVESSRSSTAAAPTATPTAKANGRRGAHDPRATRPESQLGPREMQELLRGGWTLEEVAAEAGVDVDWVSRFAAPVLAEMHRVLDRAHECTFEKPRVGPSALPLAASVRRTTAERGVRFTDEDFDEAWRAAQMDDDVWLIGFDYTSRGRVQSAEWIIDLEVGELTSNNRLGTALGYVQSARRKVDLAPPPKPKPKASTSRAVAKKAATRRAPAPKKAPARARSRASAGTAKKAAAKRGTSRGKTSKPHGDAAPVVEPQAALTTPTAAVTTPARAPRRDPWREELRRRELERSAALAAQLAGEPAPEPAPPPQPAAPPPPVAIIGPTVRTLRRRRAPTPPRPVPVPGEEADAHPIGPLPPPAPLPVPEEVRERASHTLGLLEEDEDDLDAFEDDLDLALDVDLPVESPAAPPSPAPRPTPAVPAPVRHAAPVFRGAQAAAATPVPRRRRTEPLRAR